MSPAERMFILLEDMHRKAISHETMETIPIVYQSPLSKVQGEAAGAALHDYAYYFEFRCGDLSDDKDREEFRALTSKCKDPKHKHIKWIAH